MTRNAWLLMTAALALPLAACNNADDTTTTNMAAVANDVSQSAPVSGAQDTAAGAVGVASAVMTNKAPDYVKAAAISDMYEIEASKMALQRSQSAPIKKFAQQMIDAHTATTKGLKAALGKSGLDVTPPAAMDNRRQGMLDNLRTASAQDFDKAYVDQQTAAHREALTLHKSYADDGDNAALKAFAADTAPKVQQHLDMIKMLDHSGADSTAG